MDDSRVHLAIGDLAPDFTLPKEGGGALTLSDFRGKKIILYFYPRDRTPGCTLEACAFRDAKPKFDDKNIVIIGISRDSVQSHKTFKEKHNLNFYMLSDEKAEVCEKYGVLVKNPLFGLKIFELERSTFLIDEAGRIAKVWRNVNSWNHVKKLLKEI